MLIIIYDLCWGGMHLATELCTLNARSFQQDIFTLHSNSLLASLCERYCISPQVTVWGDCHN